jgi:hypothetical protein
MSLYNDDLSLNDDLKLSYNRSSRHKLLDLSPIVNNDVWRIVLWLLITKKLYVTGHTLIKRKRKSLSKDSVSPTSTERYRRYTDIMIGNPIKIITL